MKNIDILKKLKESYDNLSDVILNSDYEIEFDNVEVLNKSLNIMSTLYENIWDKIKEDSDEREELKTDCKCPHCERKTVVSDLIDYSYLCTDCDENFYYCECIKENNMEL